MTADWEESKACVLEAYPNAYVSITDWAVRVFRGEKGEVWGRPLGYVERGENFGDMTVPEAWRRADLNRGSDAQIDKAAGEII